MALSTAQLSLIEQRVSNDGPSPVVAYLLWFFLGLAGGHRFYLGRIGTGILMLLLSVTGIGLFISGPWWLVDAFLVNGMMKSRRDAIRQRLMTEFMAMGHGQAEITPAPASPSPASPAPEQPAPTTEPTAEGQVSAA